MADDILKEVAESEVPIVLRAMEKDIPKNFLFHQQLTIMMEYKKANIKTPIQQLLRYGDIDNGVYLLKTTFSTTDADLSALAEVLRDSAQLPWESRGFGFQAIHTRLSPVVMATAAAKGVNDLSVYTYKTLWLPPETEAPLTKPMFSLPDEVYLGMLNDSHVGEVNKNWPYKFSGSELYLSQQINNNFGIGLFRRSDDKLLSSAVSYHTGGISVLFTDPEFRQHGFAQVVVAAMAREIRRRGKIPHCSVKLGNSPSLNLVTKLGFKEIWHNDYICR